MIPIFAADLLAPNFGLAIWLGLTFILLLVLLRRVAWGPITTALATREERIAESMDRAEKALAEARQIQADNEKARREADQEAQRILRDARDAAERMRTEELDKTRDKIQQLQAQAESEIEREKQSALDTLRSEVADLAIQAAEKILRENMDATKQRKIVDDFLGGMSNN